MTPVTRIFTNNTMNTAVHNIVIDNVKISLSPRYQCHLRSNLTHNLKTNQQVFIFNTK